MDEIRQKLRSEGITHIFVNWREVLRYRSSYGYTDFVHPRRFEELQTGGVLGPRVTLPNDVRFVGPLDEKSRAEVRTWAPGLVQMLEGKWYLVRYDLYPVKADQEIIQSFHVR